MKGAIQADHISTSKYQFLVTGLLELTAVAISGLDEELETVDLPDRTRASAGTRPPTEFTVSIPAHHGLEIAAMELWYKEGQDPVSPTYKKPVTIVAPRLSGGAGRTYTLMGVFVSGRKTPDLEMEGAGEMAIHEYKMSADDILIT